MRISKEIISQINSTIGNYTSESGGILGCKDGMITNYEFDRVCFENEYFPDAQSLNRIIKIWSEENVEFLGVIHSHRKRMDLSYADIEYARSILRHNNIIKVHMVIYVLETKRMIDYVVYENNIFHVNLIFEDD